MTTMPASGRAGFSWGGFLWRWIVALVVVLGTFNPTDFSYFNWVMYQSGPLPVKVLVGLVLIMLYAVYLRATWFSLGAFGCILLAAFFGAVVWVLEYYGLLSLSGGSGITWIALIVLATILAIGSSWSKVRAKLTGQVDVDDIED